MLKVDFAAVVTRGGIVLWYLRFFGHASAIDQQRRQVLDRFLAEYVAQQKLSDSGVLIDSHKIFSKTSNAADGGLIFVISQPKDSESSVVSNLVESFAENFNHVFKFTQQNFDYLFADYDSFKETFLKLYRSMINVKKEVKMKTYSESSKSQKSVSSLIKTKNGSPSSSPSKGSRKEKEQRTWMGSSSKATSSTLNFSDDKTKESAAGTTPRQETNEDLTSMGDELKSLDVRPTNVNGASQSKKPAASKLSSIFSGFSLSKQLSAESVAVSLDKFKRLLMEKNVATEVAEQISRNVGDELIGKKMSSFSNLQTSVRRSLEQACANILDSNKKINFLTSIRELGGKRPYVITFCGVNGVGKSTNLAKIAHWLLRNGMSVLIAACDTFRSGAIEQLKTHLKKLQSGTLPSGVKVDLFARGYGKDPAQIAQEAIAHAASGGFQVVLIDTAGRMQDNGPLMNALGKLVLTNQPDCVLFVGEALVGNEAVDQIRKFDQALAEHSSSAFRCQINGIVLTKFDTIDDKVGAALSMTYITGKPICFVGTGQTYADIRKLDTQSVVNSIFA